MAIRTDPDAAPPVAELAESRAPRGTADERVTTFLTATAAPGATDLRAAAWWQVGGIAATVVWWEAVAYLIAGAASSIAGSATTPVAVWVVAGVVAVAARAACARLSARRGVVAAHRITTALQERLTGTAALRSTPAAVAHDTIDLASDIGTFHRTVAPARAAAGPACAVVLAVIAWQHWPVAILLALATPFIPVNMRLAGLSARDAAARQLADVRRLSAVFLDRFAALRTIRTLGAVEREAKSVEAAATDLNRSTMRVLQRAFISATVLDVIVTFAIALAATYVGMTLLGYVRVPGTGQLSLGGGLAVLLLVPLYFEPLRAVAAGYHERDRAEAAAEVLADEIPSGTAVSETAVSGTAASDRAESAVAPLTVPPSVIVADLTVTAGNRTILRDVSVRAPAGALVAEAGPSGAGKTTLLTCLAGLRLPDTGQIRWATAQDEQAPTPGAASWIGQRTVILAATLGDNIALGDRFADAAALTAAAHAAGLGPLLDRLPDGLGQRVGTGGWELSAGEARRVALARAILRDSALWLLDEPTAHLDAATERDVLDSIVTAAAGRTVIVATHSPAILQRAQTIWRVSAGTVAVEAAQGGDRR